MNSKRIRATIVEGDRKKAEQIKEALPDYFDVNILSFPEAKEKLGPDDTGNLPQVAIMDSDDKSGHALNIYKYMCEDPKKLGLRKIPVVLLTIDEFSDSAMEFLDEGSPFFYTGDIEDSDFFINVIDAVEEAELWDEDELYPKETIAEKLKSKDTNADKLVGMKYEINSGEDGPARIAAYSDATTINRMLKLAGQTKKKVQDVFDVIEEVAKEREATGEPLNYVKKSEDERIAKPVRKGSEWVKKEKPISNPKNEVSELHRIQDVVKVKQLLDEGEQIEKMPQPAMQNYVKKANVQPVQPSNVFKPKGYSSDSVNQNSSPKVLIVDKDPKTKKALELFAGNRAEYIQVDSNMKAGDYFIRKTADVVMIEYKGLDVPGLMILKGIRIQPNGMRARAVIFMDQNASAIEKERVARAPGVVGIVEKPIVKKQLLSVLNRCNLQGGIN